MIFTLLLPLACAAFVWSIYYLVKVYKEIQ